MKTLIVCYSLTGNTRYAASQAAKRLGADVLEISPVKAYPDSGAKKFLWGGKSSLMAEKPRLRPYEFSAGEYEQIVFAFPVWAGSFAPPIRTFVSENAEALRGKRICAMACQSGSGGEKAFKKLESCLGIPELRAKVILTDPKDRPSEENGRRLEEFFVACL